MEQAVPVCPSPHTVVAAYDLLVALCIDCVPNLRHLAGMIIDMYYTGELDALTLRGQAGKDWWILDCDSIKKIFTKNEFIGL